MTTKEGGLRGSIRNVGVGVSAIPDSVVTRTDDDDSVEVSETRGFRFETNNEWPEIGGEISGNTTGVTRARIFRVSDDQLMGDVTFSSKSAGDTFTINLTTNLVNGETYYLWLDAEGSSYTQGYKNLSGSFPITSPDGDLSITNGSFDDAGSEVTSNNVYAVRTFGNVGF